MSDLENYKLQLDKLRKLLKPPKTFDAAIEAALNIHAITHASEVSSSSTPTLCDRLLKGLTNEDYSVTANNKGATIAWHLWHIARIEDLVGNLLIAEQSQILNDDWMTRLNVTVKDTGNSMTDREILEFSEQTDKPELINYRNAVGAQTRKLLKLLTPNDLKRKPGTEYLTRLVSEGGLAENKKSLWLKDFWGGYTVTGLLLLPLTYHHMLHLPDSMSIKLSIKKDNTR